MNNRAYARAIVACLRSWTRSDANAVHRMICATCGGLKRFAVPTADGRRVCHASWRGCLYDRVELLRGILQNLLPFTSATNIPALIALLPRLG